MAYIFVFYEVCPFKNKIESGGSKFAELSRLKGSMVSYVDAIFKTRYNGGFNAFILFTLPERVLLGLERRKTFNVWGCPGGRMDKSDGGHHWLCAIRELREESGISFQAEWLIYFKCAIVTPDGVTYVFEMPPTVRLDAKPDGNEILRFGFVRKSEVSQALNNEKHGIMIEGRNDFRLRAAFRNSLLIGRKELGL